MSPRGAASVTLENQEIKIEYGRPTLRGRKAIGTTLAPYGQVWRTGADAAPKLTTPIDLEIADLAAPAGSYSLFVLPKESGWTLIVNKIADQWGAYDYDKANDLGRVEMTLSKPAALVEQFTIAFEKRRENAATLTFAWENTQASVEVIAQ